MGDLAALLALASAGIIGLCIASAAALKGWRGWLELKQAELAQAPCPDAPSPTPAARIEMADLKERVRRLEAIASGVDL